MLEPHLKNEIERVFADKLQPGHQQIIDIEPLTGGSINRAFKLKTNNGSVFLKYNFKDRYPSMFEAEAKGLTLLWSAGCIRIPEILYCGSSDDLSFLLLEFIESKNDDRINESKFATGLALLHQKHTNKHGLDHDNYIGSLPQINNANVNGADFFYNRRITPLHKMARQAGLLSPQDSLMIDKLRFKLDEIIPGNEPPCLLHGDLWRGNVISDSQGMPVLIDPAVYYCYREIDIGMTLLFGGFGKQFYDVYNEVYPLESGWEDRVQLFNLYPLLVHVNLFGTAYVSQVRSVLRKFTG